MFTCLQFPWQHESTKTLRGTHLLKKDTVFLNSKKFVKLRNSAKRERGVQGQWKGIQTLVVLFSLRYIYYINSLSKFGVLSNHR